MELSAYIQGDLSPSKKTEAIQILLNQKNILKILRN